MFNWWYSLETVNIISTVFQWLIVIFSVLTLIFSTRSSALQDQENRRSKETIEHQIKITKEIADSSHNKLIPRSITPDQKKLFSDISHNIPKGRVLVTSISANSESLNFSSQLVELLKSNGYNIEEQPILFIDSVPIGLKMYNGLESKVGSYSLPLKERIERIGFKIDLGKPTMVEQEIPEIIVGQKE